MKYFTPLNIFIFVLMTLFISSAIYLNDSENKIKQEIRKCEKVVSEMTDSEREECGKGGSYSKSPERKW